MFALGCFVTRSRPIYLTQAQGSQDVLESENPHTLHRTGRLARVRQNTLAPGKVDHNHYDITPHHSSLSLHVFFFGGAVFGI